MKFPEVAGGTGAVQDWVDKAKKRSDAISMLLWNETLQRWNDYNITSGRQILREASSDSLDSGGDRNRTEAFHSAASSWIPLWGGLRPPSNNKDTDKARLSSVVDSFVSSGLRQVGGVATTTTLSGEQWDAPNAWPPIQLLLIEGMRATQLESATGLAREMRDDWLRTNYAAFNASHFMFEKYNAFESGVGGGGGEYVPQMGFGWSNGVALVMLNQTEPPREKNVSSLVCEALSSSTLHLRWAPEPETDLYYIALFRSQDEANALPTPKPIAVVTTKQCSALVDDLVPSREYFVRLRSHPSHAASTVWDWRNYSDDVVRCHTMPAARP